jgi:hypothetical protein
MPCRAQRQRDHQAMDVRRDTSHRIEATWKQCIAKPYKPDPRQPAKPPFLRFDLFDISHAIRSEGEHLVRRIDQNNALNARRIAGGETAHDVATIRMTHENIWCG